MDNLTMHLKNVHGEADTTKSGRFRCDECSACFYHAKMLIGHYMDKHKFKIGMHGSRTSDFDYFTGRLVVEYTKDNKKKTAFF